MAVEISTWADLQAINSALGGDFILMNDLGSGDTGYDTYASSSANSGDGWLPIGNDSSRFTGIFDGGGYIISDLYINRISEDNIGLFGYIQASSISNLGINSLSYIGGWNIGGLVGSSAGSDIYKCFSIGNISSSYSYIGGLIGVLGGNTNINDCYSLVNPSGLSQVGGFIGRIGATFSTIYVTNSYSAGNVSGSSDVGGFLGSLFLLNTFLYTTNSFWDIESSGQSSSFRGIGKTTAEMQTQSTFTNWDFGVIWEINSGEYPNLQIFNKDAEPSITEISKVKIAGSFSSKPVMVKISGTFVEKIMKVRVGGTFQ